MPKPRGPNKTKPPHGNPTRNPSEPGRPDFVLRSERRTQVHEQYAESTRR
jgi:hypothetical protein